MSDFEFFCSLVSFGTISCTSGGTTHAWDSVWSRGEDLFVGAWSPVDSVEVAMWPGGNVPPDLAGWTKTVEGGIVRYKRGAATVAFLPPPFVESKGGAIGIIARA